ncbi:MULTISPECIES: hypothetical protein [Prauserella salsuginis group]|uniref:Uncharacterized protein n=1 Tax=Prauserella salsuginis TaxID=387889 RepID=A0ABW6G282_9PSEU|nr:MULTISPECIES: hypothetical protein [Prauserella salsuginis group]MCR3719910.1 hypothetical protein [Prauserella flava]MCR3736547.1 hypothetical protein [Prauserella salsuginis]
MGKKDPLQALTGGGSGGGLKKVVGIAIMIALFVIIVKFPGEAADWVGDLWDIGEGAIDGIVSFIRQAAA